MLVCLRARVCMCGCGELEGVLGLVSAVQVMFRARCFVFFCAGWFAISPSLHMYASLSFGFGFCVRPLADMVACVVPAYSNVVLNIHTVRPWLALLCPSVQLNHSYIFHPAQQYSLSHALSRSCMPRSLQTTLVHRVCTLRTEYKLQLPCNHC